MRLAGSPPNNSFKPNPCRGVGHVLYATLAHVRRPATGRLNSGVSHHGGSHVGLLSAFADRIATKHCRAELERFTAALETMTDLEIAELMVFATRMRQVIERQGVDLLDPGGLHISHPELLPQVVEQHTRMKKQGNILAASALLVWGLTLKVVGRLELLPEGKRMWVQLARGFSAMPSVGSRVSAKIGTAIDLDGAARAPELFV